MLENDWKLRQDSLLLRDALCEFFECRYGKIRFLEEKNIGKVRADMIAVLPTGLVGIEIKSHSDSYERLKNQIKEYDKYCDYNFLCAGSTHVHAKEHVPEHWHRYDDGAGRRPFRRSARACEKSEMQNGTSDGASLAQRACPYSENGKAPPLRRKKQKIYLRQAL